MKKRKDPKPKAKKTDYLAKSNKRLDSLRREFIKFPVYGPKEEYKKESARNAHLADSASRVNRAQTKAIHERIKRQTGITNKKQK